MTNSPKKELGKGNFSCSACHLKFPWLSDLRAHYRANHYRGDGERRFECSLCHYEFKQKIHLQRHMEKKHFVPQIRSAPKARSPLPSSQIQLLEGGGCHMANTARDLVSSFNQGGPGSTDMPPLDYRTLHNAMLENLQKAIEARAVAANITEFNNMLSVAAAVRAAAPQERDEDEK